MIAQKLYDAGFTDLVSVTPPDAVLAPGSSIAPGARGKAPGVLAGGNHWIGYSFTKIVISPERIDSTGANIGLLGDRFPGLDIDVDDPVLAKAVATQALRFFGRAPMRLSTGSRMLFTYRAEEPFARMALSITYKGVEHTVEVLGKGRQYVIHGGHPSGSEYRWDRQPLYEWPYEIPVISKASVGAFFQELTFKLGDRAECHVIGSGTLAEAPPQEDLLAPSPEDVEDLVHYIPNTDEHFPDRSHYIDMAFAIKAAGGDRGDFLDWCSRWEDGDNDLAQADKDWDSLTPPFRIGWGWLQDKARELSGYEPATDIFTSDPDAKPTVPSTHDTHVDLTDEWAVAQILPDLKERLRYIPNSKKWYVWDEYRWVAKGGLGYESIIRDHLNRLCLRLREMGYAAPGDEGKPFTAAASRYQNLRGIESVVKLARAWLAEDITDFDKDPMVLNTPGGVVDLRTGDMTSSQKEDLLSRSTAVAPEQGKAPLFKQFMLDLTGGDKDLASFLQRYMGYCLTGDVSEKVLAFAWGSDSDTGKSTFVRVMSLLFGDYADSVDVEAFITARTGGRIPDDIARLPGARLVTATEPSAGQHWDEKTIKAITGGDEISARFMRQSWFTFKPQFKILVVGNVQPELKTVDSAMLRRVMIVPMNHPVAREDQIEDLAERMVAEEGPAILHWLVRGCLLRASEGLSPPEAVIAQTNRYKDTQDVLEQWLKEECDFDAKPEGTTFDTSRRELYVAWKIWCRGGDFDHGNEKSFKVNMDARAKAFGLSEKQVGKGRKRGYRGIRLKHSVNGAFE